MRPPGIDRQRLLDRACPECGRILLEPGGACPECDERWLRDRAAILSHHLDIIGQAGCWP